MKPQQPPMTVDELADVLEKFFTSKNPSEGRDVLLSDPRLLDPRLDETFDQLVYAAEYENDTRTAQAMTMVWQIVINARRVGMFAATAHLSQYR